MAAEPLKSGSGQPPKTPASNGKRKRSEAEMAFAYGTKVEVAASRAEAESKLSRFGAKRIVASWDGETGNGWILFELNGRYYRLDAPPREVGNREPEQVHRERWRALLLLLKARLEIVRSGMATFEQEFVVHAILPDGRTTVGEQLEPALVEMYQSGQMGNLLTGFGAPRLPEGKP